MMARDGNGRFVAGSGTAGPGRKQGSKNKVPQGIKEAVLWVAERLNESPGKSLLDVADADPAWFWEKVYGKMLPKNVEMSGEIGIKALTDDQLRDLLAQLRKSQA